MTQDTKAPLFQRLGGDAAVEAAVDEFYRRMLLDDRVARFFESVDMEAQRAKQKSFLAFAFGGPHGYSGKDMRAAHAPLLAQGLNDEHVDVVLGHLLAVLESLGVDAGTREEVRAIAESTRDDVLGR